MVNSRRARAARKLERRLIALVALVLLAAFSVIWYLVPRETEKPLVTLYERADCQCCHRWAEYMKRRGFRVQVGIDEQWPKVRAGARVLVSMRACHTAVVDGLLIEGHVPAGDVRQILRRPEHDGFVALVLPGMPDGSPGMETLVHEPYTVFGLRASGELSPLFEHHEHEID